MMKTPPPVDWFEDVACYLCGASASSPLVDAEDDLTGKPGRFRFVTCNHCVIS